uniref:Kelch-like ECH-associated protein 1a n=1 Tax=Neogobius melanostomus TaxID=47308 RepID=A0A8C6TVW4_9GOBI
MHCPRKRRPTRDSDFSAIVVPSMHWSGYLDYTVEGHASRCLSAMDQFRKQEALCDVVLRVAYKDSLVDFKVHKVVLASCSSYFRAMFTSNFKECSASEVTLRDVCPQVVGKLIDFAYTARITVGEKCVLHVLLGAMRYQMEDVAKACCDFLTKHLEPSNVIGIARFAEEIGCTELHMRSREYINTHFSEVTKEEEFFSLSHCQLLELISQDSIKVLCESEVYKACTDWVRSDMEGRSQYLHALLNAVHIYALPPKFLKSQLQSCPILSKANSCKDFLAKIFQDMTLRKLTPGPPLRGSQLIYVAGGYIGGGYSNQCLSALEAFDPRRNMWMRLADMGAPCSGLGACTLFGLLYTVGGRNMSLQDNMDSRALCCYNPMTNQWSAREPMNTPRNRVGVAVMDGCIYAVGGLRGPCTTAAWRGGTQRPTAGASSAPCWWLVLGLEWSAGGCPLRGRGVRWTEPLEQCGEIPARYQQLGAVILHEHRTQWSRPGVLGLLPVCHRGYDGHRQLALVERYNIPRNTWEPRAPMQQCRSALGVAVYAGCIYVFGGYNQHGFLSSVECYCAEQNQWTVVMQMRRGLSGMGVAVTMEPCPGSLPELEEEDQATGT